MNRINERELRDAVIATKKDSKLIAAAKNDRINSPAGLYSELAKLPPERQRDIIVSICNDHFVASQWKIAFPLNNLPATFLPEAVRAIGKALFFSREEDSVKEAVRTLKIYQQSTFFKQIAALLEEAAEIVGEQLVDVAKILSSTEIFGMVRSFDPAADASLRMIRTLGKTAIYTKDLKSTVMVAKFLYARRYSTFLNDLAEVLENAVFLARDRKSVREILHGFTAGSIDAVLQKSAENKQTLAGIRDIAWKSRNAQVISEYLSGL